MIFRKSYNKPATRDVVIVTDEGEYPIWEKDFSRLFATLNPGDVIDNEDELVNLAVMRGIKKSAVKKISAGNITRNALIRRIMRERMFGIYPSAEQVEFVIDKLDRAGFINDTLYAKRYVEKTLEKQWGEYKIRASMRERGFKSEDIDKALLEADPDWEEMARAFIEANPDTEREAMFRKLQARGFSTSIITSVLNGD